MTRRRPTRTPQACSLRNAARLAGVPFPTAARWCQQGLIRLKGYKPAGWPMFKPLPWTAAATVELVNLGRLRHVLSLQELKRAARFLRETLGHNPFSSGRFMVIDLGKRELIKLCDSGEMIALLRQPGQLLLPLWEQKPEDP